MKTWLTFLLSLLCHVELAHAVLIGWNPSPTATGYKISWGTNAGVYPFVVDVRTNLTIRLIGLTPGTSYHIAAKAYNTAGESDLSPELIWLEPFPLPKLTITANLQVTTDLLGPWTNVLTMIYTNTLGTNPTFYRALLTITNQ